MKLQQDEPELEAGGVAANLFFEKGSSISNSNANQGENCAIFGADSRVSVDSRDSWGGFIYMAYIE